MKKKRTGGSLNKMIEKEKLKQTTKLIAARHQSLL